jgi:transposase
MQAITTIGLDIAKSVFQVHGIDAEGNVSHPPSAEAALRAGVLLEVAAVPRWSRGLCHVASLVAPTRGARHTVRLMPPVYVKPYVKRQKNDAADAEAICEAVTRANMRFVETKTPEQQSCLMLHRTRQLFIR